MPRGAVVRSQVRRERFAEQGGFSILQLIVAFQIFAILAVTSLPAISRVLRGYRLRGAAHEILAQLEAARLGAVMGNHRYRFLVVDTHTFQLHDDTNSNGAVDLGETVMTRNIQRDNPGVQINSGSSNITFTANGTASSYGTITVSNESVATERLNVLVNAGGRVRIQ